MNFFYFFYKTFLYAFLKKLWPEKQGIKVYFSIIAIILAIFFITNSLPVKGVTLNTTIVYAEKSSTFHTSSSLSETLTNPNGTSFDIEFPEDALTTTANIKMEMWSVTESFAVFSRPLPSNKLAGDTFYNISLAKTSDSSSVTSFDKSVTLTFHYTDSDISGIDESTLAAYRWDGSNWVALTNSTIDTSANTITATTQEFSFFSLIGDALTPSPACGNGSCSGDETCSTCPADCGSCPSGGGGGGGGGGVAPSTRVIFSGKAYPKSTVTLLKDAQVAATTAAGSNADFQIDLSGLSTGNYIFSLYSEDNKGRRSSLLTFPLSVTRGATTNVSGIFIAPTIDVDKSEVKRGDYIAIFGLSASQVDVVISVTSEEEFFAKTISDKDGIYLHHFDTVVLDYGSHYTKSKASVGNQLVSSFSRVVNFKVGTKSVAKKEPEVLKGDSNDDGQVNLVDFSITAYWYKRPSPPANVDLNSDGKVDLVDFSILAYYWTG